MTVPTPSIPGPFADPTRAVEIALMDTFGLLEFTELTGIPAGDYGIFRVTTGGVSLALAADFEHIDLSMWTAEEQLVMQRAARGQALIFPCSPKDFMTWYDATRGEGALSSAASVTSLLPRRLRQQ